MHVYGYDRLYIEYLELTLPVSVAQLKKPVSPQENKHRIGSDCTFFYLVLSSPPDQK